MIFAKGKSVQDSDEAEFPTIKTIFIYIFYGRSALFSMSLSFSLI